jgi:hypothetical protein
MRLPGIFREAFFVPECVFKPCHLPPPQQKNPATKPPQKKDHRVAMRFFIAQKLVKSDKNR